MPQTCNRCDLSKGARMVVNGVGPKPADIMIIGQNPGEEEEKTGKPFVGPAGKKLDKVLAKAGLDKKKLFIVNACRCRPGINRTPKTAEIEACKPFLLQDIQEVQPKVVVLLGNPALQSILGHRTGITDFRGNMFRSPYTEDAVVIPGLHPSYLLKNWEETPLLIRDLSLARQVAEGKRSMEKIPVDYRIVRDIKGFRKLIEKLCQSPAFSFDLETSPGKDWTKDDILCISFSCEEARGYVVPLQERGENPVEWSAREWDEIIKGLNKLFSGSNMAIAQNGAYDVKFLHSLGVEVKNFGFDTMLAHHLVEENLPHGLKPLATLYTDMGKYDDELESMLPADKNKRDFGTLPRKALYPYAAADSDATYRVYKVLDKVLCEERVDSLYRNLTMPLQQAIIGMEVRGVLVDMDKVARVTPPILREIKSMEQEIHRAVGHPFNVGSHPQLRQVLYKELNLPVIKKTDTGLPSTDKETLEDIRGLHPVVSLLLRWRANEKVRTTYLGSAKSLGVFGFVREDGRIHPNYLIHGTETGRLSCVEPPLQTIPKDSMIRNIFVSPDGWYFLQADYSQAETRVMAWYAKDANMMKALEGDIHSEVASLAYGIPLEQITKGSKERDTAKTLVHGMNYRRWWKSIARQLGIPDEEAEGLYNSYFQKFPNVKRYQDSIESRIKTRGVLESVFGRRRRLYGALDGTVDRMTLGHIYREGISFIVQGTASDIMSFATVRIHQRMKGYKSGLIMTLHDELFAEVAPDELDDTVQIFKEEMERPVPEMGDFWLPVEIEVGKCWGDPEAELVYDGTKTWKGKEF